MQRYLTLVPDRGVLGQCPSGYTLDVAIRYNQVTEAGAREHTTAFCIVSLFELKGIV